MIFDFQHYFTAHKRIFLSLIIFLIVFVVLGIPFTKWGFFIDDFGAIFHSQVKSLDGFFKFFYQDARVCLLPSNYEFGQASFFSVYYRPLIFVVYYLQGLIFGICPYGFYLVTVGLHALNSVLLFNIIFNFSNVLTAFLAAMFFAFHSSLFNWFGWISAQQQQISLFFILLIFIFLKKYLDTNKLFYYLFSLAWFVLALFTRETALILPFLIWYGVFLYKKWKFLYSFNFAFCFFVIDFIYLTLRIALFTLNTSSANTFDFVSLCCALKSRLYEFVCIATDFLDLSLFPPGCSYIKSCIFLITFLIFLILFFYNSKKKWIVFFGLSGFCLLWPAVFASYGCRYLYEALPFFIIAVVFCMNFSEKIIPTCFKKIGTTTVILLIIINFIFFIFCLKNRAQELYCLEKAYDDLVNNKFDKRPICGIGLAHPVFAGLPGAIKLRDKNLERLVYYDLDTMVYAGYIPSSSSWKKLCSFWEDYAENYLIVTSISNGFRLKTSDSNKIYLGLVKKGEKLSAMGKIIVNKVDDKGRVCELTFIIDEKWLKQNPVFITWDYLNKKFVILNP